MSTTNLSITNGTNELLFEKVENQIEITIKTVINSITTRTKVRITKVTANKIINFLKLI
jgi:hypothetical protein